MNDGLTCDGRRVMVNKLLAIELEKRALPVLFLWINVGMEHETLFFTLHI